MTAHEAIRQTQALLRAWAAELADERPLWPDDPEVASVLERRAEGLEMLIAQSFDPAEDAVLAAVGTLKALDLPADYSPRRRAAHEADQDSILHETGRWEARLLGTAGPGGIAATLSERDLGDVLRELEGQQLRLGRALAEFAAVGGSDDGSLNAALERFADGLQASAAKCGDGLST